MIYQMLLTSLLIQTQILHLPTRFIAPDGACVGDVLVLTKPIGTQIAVNAHQWMDQKDDLWKRISSVITPEECLEAFKRATSSMARLNRTGAKLMKKYGAHCATDVTGYGILGHASCMAKVRILGLFLMFLFLPCHS